MRIIITQWGLESYLKLKNGNVFDSVYFEKKIRPDVLLLKYYPTRPEFHKEKFWSEVSLNQTYPAKGFKMKWHQVGTGCVQLRLPIVIMQDAFLCSGYVKKNSKSEKRELSKLKTHCKLVSQNRYTQVGELK